MPIHEIIHRDPLTVLPQLAATHGGTAKLAYLDPPSNTGRTTRLGYRDYRNGAAWADLIEGVAAGCRALLQPDGSLWLHINDRQSARARIALDDVFGEENYIGTVLWERTRMPSFAAKHLVSTVDPILVYAKNVDQLAPFTHGITEPGKRVPVAHRGSRIQHLVFPPGSVRFGVPDSHHPAGDHSTVSVTATLTEDLIVDERRNVDYFCLQIPGRYSADKVLAMLTEGADFSVPLIPFRSSYASLGGKPKTASSWWSWQSDPTMPTHEDAYNEQTAAGREAFPWAKPEGLLRRIIGVSTTPGDLVVDAFAGSGTTAVAAIQTGRDFIVVEEQVEFVEGAIRPRVQTALANTA